jgi:hypothetical protein
MINDRINSIFDALCGDIGAPRQDPNTVWSKCVQRYW